VDYFKTLKSNPHMAVSLGLDIVISDLIMSPIDGLLLLRWIRTAKESPDLFVPFVMLSGAADNVNQARELGSTEFLAKPFSAQSVYKRILEVIDYPRQFVTTTHYFGPDRRRRESGSRDEDLRQTTDDDVTIVYSADKVVKPKVDSDVWYFRLPNRLKEKAGSVAGEPGVMPTKLLEEAGK
jgi:DNA-binding response OmpR family regulator